MHKQHASTIQQPKSMKFCAQKRLLRFMPDQSHEQLQAFGSPVDTAERACFAELSVSYRRPAHFEARCALPAAVLAAFELVDLADWREPAVPDSLQKQKKTARKGLDIL